MIDNRWNTTVRIDREKLFRVLVPLRQIDPSRFILELALLQHDGNFPTIRRRCSKEFDLRGHTRLSS